MDQFDAATKGDLQRLHETLTSENVNDENKHGWTALHCSILNGNAECVKHCLEMGANVNHHNSPLYLASYGGRVDVVRALLDAGALVDTASHDTPFQNSVLHNYYDVAKLLVDRGAKVLNAKFDNFDFPLPECVTKFVASRSHCRHAVIVIIGVHEYHHTTVTAQQRHQCAEIDWEAHLVDTNGRCLVYTINRHISDPYMCDNVIMF
jgi:hypothetical protein